MAAAEVTGVEVNFFAACQGPEIDGYLQIMIPEILLFGQVYNHPQVWSYRLWLKGNSGNPSFLESSCDYILPEHIRGSSQQGQQDLPLEQAQRDTAGWEPLGVLLPHPSRIGPSPQLWKTGCLAAGFPALSP